MGGPLAAAPEARHTDCVRGLFQRGSRYVALVPLSAFLVGSGCGNGDSYSTECYRVAQDTPCKSISAVTGHEISDEGSMLLVSVDSGPVRKLDANTCCHYDITEAPKCSVPPTDSGACPVMESPTSFIANACLDVPVDAPCPDQADALTQFRKTSADQVVSIDSPAKAKDAPGVSCCYVVRRRWDGG